MVVKIDKENFLFKIDKNSTILEIKSYINYWNIEGKYVLFSTTKGYFLVSKYVSYFTYEHLIKDASLDSDGKISILTEKGILRIIQDKFFNYFMIEILNVFDIKTNEKISDIITKNSFRYIPFILNSNI